MADTTRMVTDSALPFVVGDKVWRGIDTYNDANKLDTGYLAPVVTAYCTVTWLPVDTTLSMSVDFAVTPNLMSGADNTSISLHPAVINIRPIKTIDNIFFIFKSYYILLILLFLYLS